MNFSVLSIGGSTVSSSSGSTSPTITLNVSFALCANYNILPLTQSIGGTPTPSLRTFAACQGYCNNTLACLAFEIDTNPTSAAYCWIHTNATNLLTLYDATTVTQYVLIPPRFLCSSISTGPTGKEVYR